MIRTSSATRRSTSNKLGHSDIHDTIQHPLGIDYARNTFLYEGRNESLVGVNPRASFKEILA